MHLFIVATLLGERSRKTTIGISVCIYGIHDIHVNMLGGGTKLMSKVVRRQDAMQVEEQTATSTAVPSLESTALRSCCQSAAVGAVMILSEYSIRRFMACMVCAGN